ncbi:hypothetical protein [Cytobacillus firmus]|uniref:hypothetical protein n=1 Tax=Cytobacillus firmus TaxID=1399 RepID=UPI003002935F
MRNLQMLIILLSSSLLVWIAVLIDSLLGLKSLDRLEDTDTMTEGPFFLLLPLQGMRKPSLRRA